MLTPNSGLKSSLLTLLFLTTMVSGCIRSKGENETLTKKAINVTDFRGREFNFDKPATRIVCLIESALSGLYMLRAEDKIVGISSNVYNDNVAVQYASLDERIKNKTLLAPGNWDFVNIESVVALKPDLVILWSSQVESIQAIESKGIPVYAVMLKSTQDVYKEISDLGKLTGKQIRADSLINYTKDELSKPAVANKQTSKGKKKVYFIWPQGPLETSGKNSTVNELIRMAGATNVCISPDEHIVVNLEKVIEWNPDIIVMWYDANKNPEDIIRLSGWSNIKAVKDKQVFELPSVFFCDLWTLKFQYAAKLLSTWCYPSVFKGNDLDKEKHQMILKLYGEKGESIK
jgi:iron complex transport system substrate-binding protein